MRIPNNFIPNKKLRNKEGLSKYLTIDKKGLAIGLIPISPKAESYIYVWKEGMKLPKKVRERPGAGVHLCFHDGILHDAGEYNGVYYTLEDTLVYERPDKVWDLCSHNDELYDLCGLLNEEEGISLNLTVYGQSLLNYPQAFLAICSHENNLYVSQWKSIYNFSEKCYFGNSASNNIHALASYEKNLYAGAYKEILHVGSTRSLIIAKRKNWINTLCEYNGMLIDGGDYEEVFNTITDDILFRFESYYVTDLEPIPVALVNKFLQK